MFHIKYIIFILQEVPRFISQCAILYQNRNHINVSLARQAPQAVKMQKKENRDIRNRAVEKVRRRLCAVISQDSLRSEP